jgi:hypothetical protein
MKKKTVYPFKIMITIFFTLLPFVLILSAVLFNKKPVIAIYFFLIGLIIVLAITLINLLLHGIKLSEDELIIKMIGYRGYTKFRLKYKNILRLEMKKEKAKIPFLSSRYYFIIYLKDNIKSSSIIINEERYFVKHLRYMFEYLNKTYSIPQ